VWGLLVAWIFLTRRSWKGFGNRGIYELLNFIVGFYGPIEGFIIVPIN